MTVLQVTGDWLTAGQWAKPTNTYEGLYIIHNAWIASDCNYITMVFCNNQNLQNQMINFNSIVKCYYQLHVQVNFYKESLTFSEV